MRSPIEYEQLLYAAKEQDPHTPTDIKSKSVV